ncbi:MAG: protein CapI [Hydrogenophilales bacterium CG03_land_8_20_14_0_80_62_28]|nr:MAG: protein CapI [Hydrogenophilaceae bacterium CG1_02_62_390]PIV21717.1 MAG: protein CapI [Hydrogenophilales bacterium CG03_land_8_20_14_0_80_62_28]PIW38995.1 MAG: protein CapI [Hydrogenophilales bacterium CG15_BIG_FIL_POST_REV_8_21_14_020_62_31]PIW71411.1 MAG: protein CapI [Hydrogenophilales bacterium CG12_big_fil_rev_8_21_14_0_65_61_21]PIY97616.1 MAG: protein CapI [Hydrogenophilales bacterium CG_4_10_14_0_8_um_filter_62_70]
MKVLITGCAGFIGMHVAQLLLARGDQVVGVDNLNDYYDPALKLARLAQLQPHAGFRFIQTDIADAMAMEDLFAAERFNRVVNLAAQPGVRYSLKNPHAYIQTNLVGFGNILEGCRHNGVEHLVYASSSSVYGANTRMPFSVHDNVDHPVSLYAASKKANELMAHSYSHLYGLPSTGLRYFTVYGPWGRPDMSPWLFTSAILEDRTIDVFNQGRMQRDFTYIDDIAEGTVRVLDRIAAPNPEFDTSAPDPSSSYAPFRVYNIGNHEPVELMTFIKTIEDALGKKAQKRFLAMQPGDVVATYADVEDLKRDVGFEPKTPLADGIGRWVEWYRQYHGL